MVSKNPLNSYSKEILDELNVECLNFDADNYENDKEHGLPKRSDTVEVPKTKIRGNIRIKEL